MASQSATTRFALVALLTALIAAGAWIVHVRGKSQTRPAVVTEALAPPSPQDQWAIGHDIEGEQMMIDGKLVDVPADMAAHKREMDKVAAEIEAKMDAAQQERLQRFKGDDMDTGAEPRRQ